MPYEVPRYSKRLYEFDPNHPVCVPGFGDGCAETPTFAGRYNWQGGPVDVSDRVRNAARACGQHVRWLEDPVAWPESATPADARTMRDGTPAQQAAAQAAARRLGRATADELAVLSGGEAARVLADWLTAEIGEQIRAEVAPYGSNVVMICGWARFAAPLTRVFLNWWDGRTGSSPADREAYDRQVWADWAEARR